MAISSSSAVTVQAAAEAVLAVEEEAEVVAVAATASVIAATKAGTAGTIKKTTMVSTVVDMHLIIIITTGIPNPTVTTTLATMLSLIAVVMEMLAGMVATVLVLL
jgi:hypothetical protein